MYKKDNASRIYTNDNIFLCFTLSMSQLYDFATKYMIVKVATIKSRIKNAIRYIIVL